MIEKNKSEHCRAIFYFKNSIEVLSRWVDYKYYRNSVNSRRSAIFKTYDIFKKSHLNSLKMVRV